MGVLHTGVDLIEVKRLQSAIERHGDKFLDRIFTAQEREQLKDNLPSLAARWAAKEAVAKALATGIGDVSWQEIEILRGALTRARPKSLWCCTKTLRHSWHQKVVC